MSLLSVPLRLRDAKAFSEARASIQKLEPWYQPIWYDWGLKTTPKTKEGTPIHLFGRDRGWLKWKLFIERNLPFPLEGKRILDVGCNAGYFLLKAVQQGAKEAIGVEVDDHYFRQAEFSRDLYSRLAGQPAPIRLFKCPMEEFDFKQVGNVDLTFFLNSIYHVGKVKGEFKDSLANIHAKQVETLRRVAEHSPYILFEANPLKDEGHGKGKTSLKQMVKDAGLVIHSEFEAVPRHERGYILVVRRSHP